MSLSGFWMLYGRAGVTRDLFSGNLSVEIEVQLHIRKTRHI